MFDLYDSLSATTDASKVDLDKLRAELDDLNKEGQTYVFALIYHHCQKHDLLLPKLNEQVAIDLNSLPKSLVKILWKFALMHRQRMNEEQMMSKAQRCANKW